MKAYAVALSRRDASRGVRVTLLFTERNEAWETEWIAEEIESIEAEIRTDLQERLR